MDGGDEAEETMLGALEVESHGSNAENVKRKIWIENKKMWVVAAPAIFTRFSTFGINVISQAFIGHIGSTQLAAYALVMTLLLRFTNGLLLGMASALETLCGQSFGARQYHMLGIYLQRSWIILTVSATLMLPIFFFATPILKALGQNEVVAEEAGKFGLWFIPVIYSFIVSYTCQMYLQSQSKNMIISYLAACSLSIHSFLSWLLTVKYRFGIKGAMLSTIFAYWIPNVGQLIFIFAGGCPETWKGFSTLAFKDLWAIMKLSLSSGAMLWLVALIHILLLLVNQIIYRAKSYVNQLSCVFLNSISFFIISLELWYNAVLILLTGNLKNAKIEVVALAICLSINSWEMMISLGFLAAASVRVSNELGKGDSEAAKFSVVNVVLTSLAIGVVLFIFFLFFRGRLAYVFTKDRDVAAEVARLSPLLAFSILMNSVQPVLSGVAIGAGWQSIVVYVNLGCYYLIGIPFGAVLGYVFKLQVKGIWSGMIIGTFFQTIILVIITQRTDWDKHVFIARTRVNRWYEEEPTDHP